MHTEQERDIERALQHVLRDMGACASERISKSNEAQDLVWLRFENWDEILAYGTPPESRKAKHDLPLKTLVIVQQTGGVPVHDARLHVRILPFDNNTFLFYAQASPFHLSNEASLLAGHGQSHHRDGRCAHLVGQSAAPTT